MAGKSRFSVAESKINKLFQNSRRRVFSKKQIEEVFIEYRRLWNLADSMNLNKFIDSCINAGILNEVILVPKAPEQLHMLKVKEVMFYGGNFMPPSKEASDKKVLYTVGRVNVFELALNIKNRSFLSHFSAVYLNGLTSQIPKMVYVSSEQSLRRPSLKPAAKLIQSNIDKAFAKPQRKSNNIFVYEDYSFLLHDGMFTDRTGIYTRAEDGLTLTNLERTLIDIAVRPEYAGGVDAVLNAYRNAKDRVSLNKLAAYLTNINFVYPYWQVIGFYLHHAGYESSRLKIFKEHVSEYFFYLTYEIFNPDFDREWQIWYPKRLI
ncbi:MAG: hypothetical protein JNM21_05590 [Taibaiella sp.]|nr:hypothetical protein [Taibaiella sp.]